MGYQALQGVKITPRGSVNSARFGSQLENGSWPNSFAFNGWIYSANTSIGFSNQPTEIKVDIVLETTDKSQKYAFFDIASSDLRCDAGNGADENLFDIDFNGVKFTDFILFSYEISIENSVKILSVTFKDYSVILDKIYIGLIKRQGNTFVYTANSTISFPVNCTDCLLNGNSFVDTGTTTRDISYGSYAGINGGTHDNFLNITLGDGIYKQWEKMFAAPVLSPGFDLNGGYLIIGTEEASEEKCGDLAKISYNFNQLLASLRRRGMSFGGAFPKISIDGDYVYRQDYIGTLREVLQNWCSDLGFDFYCEGKTFKAINLNVALDISAITSISDPTTTLGSQFALSKNSAIISFKESNTLSNTFKQSVITADTRARDVKTSSKVPKRYVGMIPLHPLDFNFPSLTMVDRTDIFGNHFSDTAFNNSFEPDSFDANQKRVAILDNRTFGDVDTAIALTKYEESLRDIFCQDRALYGNAEDSAANFKALGMFPILEVTDPNDKSIAIKSLGEEQDGVSSLCRDQQYYRVFIGYSYPKLKQDIISWESAAAEAMYKFGAVKKGILQESPYIPDEVLQDASPASGLTGALGTVITRVTHTFEPSAQQYYDLYQLPFADILLYSGIRSFFDYYPLETWIASLSNEWGTTKEEFDRKMVSNLDDACVDEFSSELGYIDLRENPDKKFQDWKLESFRPKAVSDLNNFITDYDGYFSKLQTEGVLDRQIEKYYNINSKISQTCSKLNILILTDVRTHPNINVTFTKRGKNYLNGVLSQKYLEQAIENIKRRRHTPTLNICDVPLLQEMCDNLISGYYVSGSEDPRFACALQDPYNVFIEGFTSSQLSFPNSRGLDISIIKNPIGNNKDAIRGMLQSSDANGDFYYADLIDGASAQIQQQANLTIIYPASFEPADDDYYSGILTSNVDVQNRSPEINNIYGSPVNTSNNNSSTIKVINNPVNLNLQAQLDPFSNRFISYMTVLTGDAQILSTVEEYHNFVKSLNNYQTTGASKSVELSLAGTPANFSGLIPYLNPNYGLTKLSLSVTDNGVVTNLSYSDRPKQLPKQETILNELTPRLK